MENLSFALISKKETNNLSNVSCGSVLAYVTEGENKFVRLGISKNKNTYTVWWWFYGSNLDDSYWYCNPAKKVIRSIYEEYVKPLFGSDDWKDALSKNAEAKGGGLSGSISGLKNKELAINIFCQFYGRVVPGMNLANLDPHFISASEQEEYLNVKAIGNLLDAVIYINKIRKESQVKYQLVNGVGE